MKQHVSTETEDSVKKFKKTIDLLATLNSAVWFLVMQGHVCNKINQSPYCKEIGKENIAVNAKLWECDGDLDIC